MRRLDNENVKICVNALMTGEPVTVFTGTRMFNGQVFEIGRSPYSNDLSARIVDPEGYVHYFRPERDDCEVYETVKNVSSSTP